MCIREIADVDVVSAAGAVSGGIVIAKDPEASSGRRSSSGITWVSGE
jgi:hypothetical protein